MARRFPCPCYDCLTRAEEELGSYEICPVCFWEDDAVQARDIDYDGGANRLSLRQARAFYAEIGACEPESLPSVRKPRPEELPS